MKIEKLLIARTEAEDKAKAARADIIERLDAKADIIRATVTDLTKETDELNWNLPAELDWIRHYKDESARFEVKDSTIYLCLGATRCLIKKELIDGTEQETAYATRQIMYTASIEYGEKMIERWEQKMVRDKTEIERLTAQVRKSETNIVKLQNWVDQISAAKEGDRP